MPEPLETPYPVVSTVLVNGVLGNAVGSVSRLLERHRGYAQHQLVVMADAASTNGDWDILYMPDVSDVSIAENLSVDVGSNLTLSSAKSAQLKFTALLRGIVISEATAGDAARTFTFVLCSMKGPLINS